MIPSLKALPLLLFGARALPAAAADDPGVNGITAVAAKVSDDYVRLRLPGGGYPVERYAFGNGGNWGGEIRDLTIDRLTFLDVAHVIAPALASQQYLPAADPQQTRLLIMLYWGTTIVPEPPSDSVAYDQLKTAANQLAKFTTHALSGHTIYAGGGAADAALAQMSAATVMLNMANRQRDRMDFKNAQMLGYDSPGLIGTSAGNYARGTAFGVDRDDLYNEIEANRYFVVLMAYDFGLMRKEKKHKLLWETRFSISERHNAFDRALPIMAQNAARYFGQPSHGLLRAPVRQGTVEIQAPSLIEFVPDAKK